MLSVLLKKIISNELVAGYLPQDGRNRNAVKNIAGSFMVKSGSALVGILMVPLTIDYLDSGTYGIWLTLSSIVLWLSYFDIGLGNGLRNKFAELRAGNNTLLLRKYISTAYLSFFILFFLIWVIVFLKADSVNWAGILNAPGNMNNELKSTGIIITGFFSLQMVFKIITTILTADQKPALASFVDFIGQFFVLVSIYLLTICTEGSLILLASATGAMPVFVLLLASVVLFGKKYRLYLPSAKLIDFSCIKDIMSLGVKFFLIQIAALIIYQTGNIIIAHISGPEDVTVYNIAFRYFSLSSMLFLIVITPFWSAFTDAYFKAEYEWMKLTLNKLRKIFLFFVLLLAFMLAGAPFFYEIWIGDKVNVTFRVSVFMSLLFLLTIWNILHAYIINGIGKIKLQLYFSAAGALVYIPIAVMLGKSMGMPGVVLASIIINMVSAVYSPIQVNKIVGKRAKGIWNA